MTHKLDVSPDSSKRKGVLREKLKHLTSKLDGNGVSAKSGSEGVINSEELASKLFARASFRFLDERSLDDLALITRMGRSALESFLNGNKTIVVSTHQEGTRSSIIVVLFDRPFIVSSMVESIKQLGHDIEVLLHPVLTVNGARISLSYIEFDSLPVDGLAILEGSLREMLQDLVLVSGDFPSMVERILGVAKDVDSPAFTQRFAQSENRDIADFLRWLIDDSFIILGYAKRSVSARGVATSADEALGLFKTSSRFRDALSSEASDDATNLLALNEPLWVSRLSTESPIHRRLRLTDFTIQEIDASGVTTAIHTIIGIFSSKALSQEASTIPIIKRKVTRLIESEEVLSGSHDHKFIVDIVDRMPKEEALRLDSEALRDIIAATIDVYNRDDTRLTVRFDTSRRGLTALVVMPRDRLNEEVRQKIQNHLETTFGAAPGTGEYHLDLSAHSLARFYFHIPLLRTDTPTVDIDTLEEELATLARSWRESLFDLVSEHTDRLIGSRYLLAFGDDYQALHSPTEALADIEYLEALTSARPIRIKLHNASPLHPKERTVSIYLQERSFTLSQTIPVLEHAGFEVISESSYEVIVKDAPRRHLHRFTVAPQESLAFYNEGSAATVENGLEEIFLGHFDDDVLTSLLCSAGLSARSLSLIRAYTSLLWQLNIFPRKHLIREAIAAVPEVAVQFWKLFEIRFNPALALSLDERKKKFLVEKTLFEEILRKEKDISRDKILRALLSILEHTVRTNYYIEAPCIALKLHSEKIDIMPQPRPLYEIFVYSTDLEGVHLRSGMVSRGGIRWSERPDDFRTEVLSLMKTQRVKNVFIVPQGAKGGFVLRQIPKDPEKVGPAVRETYSRFIRSLLTLADNRVGDTVVHPEGVLAWDGEDPYFVVAADKGTATFSDVANSIAQKEYNFWLADAFASGGSNGYDHKLYGITAKGAWECVVRHFNDLEIDYLTMPFTAVGIGDMSGDVFGNGMILSDKMKLLGAFNHRHVFVDPSPDPKISFAERQRLFALPRSQWSDYNASLISKGGGIFDRAQKEIPLSPEIREALSVPDSTPAVVNGEELVTLILRARVDLLWNGGIGTYVKSDDETNADVNDAANDRVRVSASELRCKIVGEGGNLGFTQAARIQFSSLGGRINTDAIDNSGGVGLSDHEVNIKILFSGILKSGKITLEARNSLLKEMAPSVVNDVLQQNRDHAYLLSSGERRSYNRIEYFKSLTGHLQRLGLVHRHLDTLPDEDDLYERSTKKTGIFRPELAICLAAVKMWVKSTILDSNLTDSATLETLLIDYFPAELRETYRSEILAHPLRANIIATQATNILVDLLGITWVYRMCQDHSVEPLSAVRGGLAAILAGDGVRAYHSLEAIDTPHNNKIFSDLRDRVMRGLRDAGSWFIGTHKDEESLDKLIDLYRDDFVQALSTYTLALGESETLVLDKAKVSPELQKRIGGILRSVSLLEIIWAAKRCGRDLKTVSSCARHISVALGLDSLWEIEQKIDTQNKWESALLVTSIAEVRRAVSHLTIKLLEKNISGQSGVTEALRSSPGYQPLVMTMNEAANLQAGVAQMAVISKQLRTFLVS